MSLRSEVFHAVMCDYPGCTELWDNEEFTYSSEPYANTPEMRQFGWYVGEGTEGDFCPAHAEQIACTHDDEGGCVVCGMHYLDADSHAVPFPATPEGELRVMLKRINEEVQVSCRGLMHRVDRALGTGQMGGPGTLRGRTDLALNDIHARACRSIHPDITEREIRDMQAVAR